MNGTQNLVNNLAYIYFQYFDLVYFFFFFTDERRDSSSYSCAENKKAAKNSIYKEHSNRLKTDQTEDKVQPAETITFSFKESNKKICPDSQIDPPSKIFSEINEESSSFGSERSSLTDDFDSVKFEPPKHHNNNNNNYPPLTDHKKSKNNNNKKKKKTPSVVDKGMGSSRLPSSTKFPVPAKRKSFSSGGASNLLRNLITCGAVDTNDSVVVMLNRRSGGQNNNNDQNNINKAPDEVLIKGDDHVHFGRSSSSRVFRACWDHQEEKQQPHRHSTSR